MKVRSWAYVVLVALAMMLGWSITTPADVIYSDNFDAWPLDPYPSDSWHSTYPSPPWQNMFPGWRAFVTDGMPFNNTDGRVCFASWSDEFKPRWDYVQMASIPDLVSYGGLVKVWVGGAGVALGFGYVDPSASDSGWLANAVVFDNDGMIRFYSRSVGSVDLAPYAPGIWYRVSVQIDYTRLRADVFLDGVLVGSDLVTEPKVLTYYSEPVPLDKFGFFGNSFGYDVIAGWNYLDDVILMGDDIVPARPFTWGRLKTLYR